MIAILGWYNQKNIGDDAFKDAFMEGLRLAGLNEEIHFCVEEVPPWRKLILGGGDVVRPFYLDRIDQKIALFPIGVGLGYESEALLLRDKDVPIVVARNKADVEIFQKIGITAEYCPDITFVLPDPDKASYVHSKKKRLGVLLSDEVNPTFENRSANTYMYYEFFKWELAKILDNLAEFYDIHFLPFSTLDSIDDRKMNLDIYRRMERRSSVVLNGVQESVQGARSVIAGYDLVVTMKYHGMLFAVQAGVPFINIAETRKTSLFCEENDLSFLSVPKLSLEKERFLSFVKRAEDVQTRALIGDVSARLKSEAKSRLPAALARAVCKRPT